jgi:hypothetical protein
MKTFLTLSIAALLFGFTLTTAQQNDFILKTDKDTITIVKGKSCTFKIEMTLPNEFDGWVNLHSSSVLNTRISDTLVHSPYAGVTLTVSATQSVEPEIYKITLSGEYFPNSGNNSALTHFYVRILPLPYNPAQWRIFQASFMPSFVLQDGENNYWYNQCSIDGRGDALFKQNESSLIEKMKNSGNYFVEGGRRINPPIFDNNNGLIWMATRYYNNILGGVIRYSLDGKNQTIFNYQNSPLPDSSATAIAIGADGSAWIGTDKGLARLSGTEWTVYNSTNSILTNEPITSIAISDNIVWIGTTNGLVKYDGISWTRYTPQNSMMPAPFVWKMAVDVNGDLWMGLSSSSYYESYPIGQPTSMIGVAKFDGNSWVLYNNQNSPLGMNNYINSITIDKKGQKWFSTASPSIGSTSKGGANFVNGAGIIKFDNTNWYSYTIVNSPIINDNINWVGLDNNDNIWFSSYLYSENSGFWGVFNETGLPPFLAPNAVSEQPAESDGIHLFPNPTSTQFTLSGVEGVASVRVVNSLGEEVKQFAHVSSEYSIDVSDLVSGLYFVSIRTAKGAVVKPMMVSH